MTYKSISQWVLCVLLALFFFAAGLLHFIKVDAFVQIVPPFLPFPKLIVQVTGVMELLFAIGLLVPLFRRVTGILLSLFMFAVLPANIYMAMADIPFNGRDLTDFQLWFRVALQFPLIGIVLWASGFWSTKLH